MKKKKFEKLVYKYLDGTLSVKESKMLKFNLEYSPDHRECYSKILELREAVSRSANDSLKPFFENRVLENISVKTFSSINLISLADSLTIYFRKIVLTAAIMLAILVTYNLTNGNKYSIENLLGISKTNYEYAFDPLNNLIGSGK
jgi:hypothetical protein